jgi:hypothetical protein
MVAAVTAARRWPYPRLTWKAARRAVAAGVAWGAIFTAGVSAHTWLSCGVVCLDDVLATAAVSIAVGIGTMGPLAALGRRT